MSSSVLLCDEKSLRKLAIMIFPTFSRKTTRFNAPILDCLISHEVALRDPKQDTLILTGVIHTQG